MLPKVWQKSSQTRARAEGVRKINPRRHRSLVLERLERRELLAAVSVVPTVETAALSSADDVAIWIHPTDPSQSRIIGTAKSNSSTSLRVYDLAGRQVQSVASNQLNNIDLRYNFPLAGNQVGLLGASNRSNNSLAFFKIDGNGQLQNIAARTISTGMTVYGFAMYYSTQSGKYYAFVSSESGVVQQWELFDNGAGKVDARQVRTFSVGSKVEGIVADDVLGVVYLGEESRGIWKYSAEPSGGSARTQVAATSSSGPLRAEVEGLSLYYASNGTGYLLASSQGINEFAVYRREGNNPYVGNFKLVAGNGVDAVTDTDGIDVTNASLGSSFPSGMFVAQDSDDNFKLARWDSIAGALGGSLTIDTTWDPRLVGAGPLPNARPTASAGLDQTVVIAAAVTLDGGWSDDGRPSGLVTTTWSKISGPGEVTFGDASSVDTSATFNQVGVYVLQLSIDDGELIGTDEVTITVSETPPPPPPVSTLQFQDGVFPNTSYAGTRDTQIRSDSTSATAGSATTLNVDGSPDYAALLQWNVSQIPVGSVVSAASIRLYVSAGSSQPYELYELKRNWTETAASWSRYASSLGWGTSGARATSDRDSVVLGAVASTGTGVATVTLNQAGIAVVQKWINNPASNFGFIIQDYTSSSDGLSFLSSEHATKANRPLLSISYAAPALPLLLAPPGSTENKAPLSIDLISTSVSKPPDTRAPSSPVPQREVPAAAALATVSGRRVIKPSATLYEAIYGELGDAS